MRIYELAKKLGVKSKSIISELSKLGIDGKTPSSNIEQNLANTLEILFKKTVRKRGFDKKERLQELKKLSKDRWSEYQIYNIPIRSSDHVHLREGSTKDNNRISYKEVTEKPKLISDEVLKSNFSNISSQIYDVKTYKQKETGDDRFIIAAIILSSIFIIGVMIITVFNNYYVWRDRIPGRFEKKSLDLQKDGTAQLFTIQAGAFIDAFYANSLKNLLTEKGYHAFISYSKEKKLYKVFIGKFSERLEAERQALEIKKAEGLQTFVTLWDRKYSEVSESNSYLKPSAKPI